jgi:hypothetical protein
MYTSSAEVEKHVIVAVGIVVAATAGTVAEVDAMAFEFASAVGPATVNTSPAARILLR